MKRTKKAEENKKDEDFISPKEKDEYRKWMLGKGFSISTITHTLSFPNYLAKKGLDLHNITEESVTDFIIKSREEGVNVGALNAWIKQINRWCKFKGFDVHLEYFKSEGARDVEYIPDEKVKAMIDYVWNRYDLDSRNRAILAILFSTGMRVSELVSLNWNDIDFERKLILIRHGKGNKSRKVPVPQKALDYLESYRKVRANSDPRAVFTSEQGRLRPGSIRRICKKVGNEVGYPQMHPHLARHWRAKNLLRQGIPPNTVQKIMGHANLKTTSIYLEASLDEIVMDIETKDHFFNPEGKKKGKGTKKKGD